MKVKSIRKTPKFYHQSGFTLIELLVVVTVIGILAAIALPSFLTQSGKAKQTEAKQNINLVSKTQQAYYLENKRFSINLDEIGVGSINGSSTSSTGYYTYLMAARTNINKDVHIHAYARQSEYRSYVAETVVYQDVGVGGLKLMTAICENIDVNNTVVHASTDPIPNSTPYHTASITCLASDNARRI